MKISIKGDIISDRQQRFYDWLGIAGASPSKVIAALPKGKRDVEVIINSGGGDVFAGSEIYTALREYEGNVTVKIVGVAASAASVIAMAADKVLMSPTALMMIHNVSIPSASGDYRALEKKVQALKSANQSIINAYKAKTGKGDEELTVLMDNETWFNAEKAVQEGFVDEILAFSKDENKENQLVASFNETFLTPEAIEKLEAFIENESAPPIKNTGQLEARFKLLKLKGEHL